MMMGPIILTVEAAMHIVFDMPCFPIYREELLEMNHTEYNVSQPSHKTFDPSTRDNLRPTFGRWTSEK